jgi:2-polyprenyl-3-methyl-5-hydroxy-6-metoxy-1,4-benzoquinol methylase
MTMRHDAYQGLAGHYDLHGWDWYASTYGAKLMALLEERGLAAGASILDAGCGTGSLAVMLARAGYRVTGVDLSPGMIARAKAKDPSGEVDWRVGDITALELGATFDAAVSVADVFNHLELLADWESALRSIHRHVGPGGLVCIDAMTCRGLEQMDVQLVQERGGVTLILSIIYERAVRRSTLKMTSFAPSAAGPPGYDRAQETITEWGQPVREVLPLFARAGFSDVERVWATSDEAESDDRLTLLARR